jgi:antitoxin component YwqK of YwqJK toxin-antitoxin module
LKFVKINILIFLFFFSCDDTVQENENIASVYKMKIPSIEINKVNNHLKLKNGILYFEGKQYSGIVNEFYEDENIKSKSEYYKGKRHGFFLGWYRNGEQWFERFYIKGLKSGVHKGWYKNGVQMFEYHFNNKGVYHGVVKDWYTNGMLTKYFNFVQGKESGSQKMWDLKGKLRANFYTINGERHGLIGLKKCVSVLKTEIK